MQIDITPQDAATVRAILLTHATLQNMRAMESEQLHGRIKRDEGDTELLEDLEDQVETFDGDAENLQRIAELFPEAV